MVQTHVEEEDNFLHKQHNYHLFVLEILDGEVNFLSLEELDCTDSLLPFGTD